MVAPLGECGSVNRTTTHKTGTVWHTKFGETPHEIVHGWTKAFSGFVQNPHVRRARTHDPLFDATHDYRSVADYTGQTKSQNNNICPQCLTQEPPHRRTGASSWLSRLPRPPLQGMSLMAGECYWTAAPVTSSPCGETKTSYSRLVQAYSPKILKSPRSARIREIKTLKFGT